MRGPAGTNPCRWQTGEEYQVDDPLAFVSDFQQRFRVADLGELPRFNGGLVGYFGYDVVRYVEPRLKNPAPKTI